MNKTLTILLISFLTIASPAVYSDANHSHESKGSMDMGAMNKQMGDMQKTMDKIGKTKNQKDKQKLMATHMEQMHKGLDMMDGMMMGNMDKNKMMSGNKDNQVHMMGQRMDMMQMMMEQMMGQMGAMSGMDHH